MMDAIFQQDIRRHSGGDHIRLIEAPEPVQEAAVILRRIKRLLLVDNAQPDDILIALRDWPRYAGHLAALGALSAYHWLCIWANR